MPEHHPDMDLIMALAGGELPPEEAARIESQLDPEARAELAAQRAVLARLGELGRPALTTDESRRLRAAVRKELVLDRDRPYATVPRIGRRPRFARTLPALAAAASLVAVIAIAVNLADRSMEEAAPEAAAPTTTAAPATTVALAETTAAPTTSAMEAVTEMAMVEVEADMLAEAEAAMELEEAAAAMETTGAAAEYTTTTTTAPAMVVVTDTVDYAFAFSTDRPDDALLFTDAVIAERGEAAFPTAQLAERAAAAGLVCWEHVADSTDPEDAVSFMGYGLVDGEEGEAYRIEPGPSRSQEGADEDDPLVLLFAYPECRPVDFRAG